MFNKLLWTFSIISFISMFVGVIFVNIWIIVISFIVGITFAFLIKEEKNDLPRN